MSRLYLGSRDVRSPEAARHATFDAISRVGLRRPWWMPGPLYRALLRSVVTESGWEQKR